MPRSYGGLCSCVALPETPALPAWVQVPPAEMCAAATRLRVLVLLAPSSESGPSAAPAAAADLVASLKTLPALEVLYWDVDGVKWDSPADAAGPARVVTREKPGLQLYKSPSAQLPRVFRRYVCGEPFGLSPSA